MNIAEIPLPCTLKPSLLNLAKRINANEILLYTDDDCIETVGINVFRGEMQCIAKENALGFEISKDLAVRLFLYDRHCTIHFQDISEDIQYKSEVTKGSIFSISPTSYYLFLYGSNSVETYSIENNKVTYLSSLQFSNKCHLLAYTHDILFIILTDGTLNYYQIDNNTTWQQIGLEVFNTYRITDICCSNFPNIAISTWEGHVYLKQLQTNTSQPMLTPLKSIELSLRDDPLGEFCGSFIQYNRGMNVYVISRAINKELIVMDASLNQLLMSIRFPTFFRGLLVSEEDEVPLIIGLTNKTTYSFFLPPIHYLQNVSISIASFNELRVTRCLAVLRSQYPSLLQTSSNKYAIMNHCIRYELEDKQALFFSKRILNATVLNDHFFMIGFTDAICVFDLQNKQVVHTFQIPYSSILSILFLLTKKCTVVVVVNCISSDTVVSYKATIQLLEVEGILLVKQTPLFQRLELIMTNDNRPLSLEELYQTHPEVFCNVIYNKQL